MQRPQGTPLRIRARTRHVVRKISRLNHRSRRSRALDERQPDLAKRNRSSPGKLDSQSDRFMGIRPGPILRCNAAGLRRAGRVCARVVAGIAFRPARDAPRSHDHRRVTRLPDLILNKPRRAVDHPCDF